jgi:hypothetical protein
MAATLWFKPEMKVARKAASYCKENYHARR